jgi:hypothetical protein
LVGFFGAFDFFMLNLLLRLSWLLSFLRLFWLS